ncbi:MAG: hypothetical protein JWO88_3607 [Frankiales bacterium]|nr:hypothetical protein [Frankiales bacterium]
MGKPRPTVCQVLLPLMPIAKYRGRVTVFLWSWSSGLFREPLFFFL